MKLLGLLTLALLMGCVGVQTVEYEPVPSPMGKVVVTDTVMNTAVPHPTPTAIPTDEPMSAANADVTFVRAVQTDTETWTFHVTVEHPDTGWEDYADGWDVVLPDGTAVKPTPDSPFTRLLLHPHETEQPFTRSQSNIVIPANITQVTVRAHDLVDGFGGEEVIVDLTAVSGPNFEVEK